MLKVFVVLGGLPLTHPYTHKSYELVDVGNKDSNCKVNTHQAAAQVDTFF